MRPLVRCIVIAAIAIAARQAAATLDQSSPGDLVVAAARGAVRGSIEAPILDDRICSGTPLAPGCF